MRQSEMRGNTPMLIFKTAHFVEYLRLHVDGFSWDFYNRDSFDETIENLLYLEDLFCIILCFLHSIFTHIHIYTYMYVC